MISNKQFRVLMKKKQERKSLEKAAMMSGMDVKTGRKYILAGKPPSELKKPHTWRTREFSFEEDWAEITGIFRTIPGLDVKTVFEWLQREYPGRYQDGQLRTLQRHAKRYKALHGPAKEVFFDQKHEPGRLAQSDYTCMNKLEITIKGELFPHLVYHFVLTYSNWETGTVCFSESFESLSEGLQSALWELGKVPAVHQTDQLSAAVNTLDEKRNFTKRYQALLDHYKLSGLKSQPASPNENGNVEQGNYRFKHAADQMLKLRGSRDFASREEYSRFLEDLFKRLNTGRLERLQEELKVMGALPVRRIDSSQTFEVRVRKNSTVTVQKNVYSVHSRLRDEKVRVRTRPEHLEVWYAQKMIDVLPRLRGSKKHCIQYHHIIDSLVKKPGAFENYRYRDDLYPTTHFRIAYDVLRDRLGYKGVKEYLKILYVAASESEMCVDNALRDVLAAGKAFTAARIKDMVVDALQIRPVTEVEVSDTDLSEYDLLFDQLVVTGEGGVV